MNNKPVDKTKKSNIKCEHCKYWDRKLYICTLTSEDKHYWNRCKRFEWAESEDKYVYRELLSEGSYDNAAEYAQLLAFAKAEFEEEVMKEEYKQEYFKQIVTESEGQGMTREVEDCISRQAVLKKIFFAETSPIGSDNILKELSYSVENMPTAMPKCPPLDKDRKCHCGFCPERPKGEWIESEFDVSVYCSECNAEFESKYRWCPHCGADMRGTK